MTAASLPITRRTVKMLDERVVDKSYQQTPIGRQVKHWLETLRFQNYAPNTIDSYETLGARLATEFRYLDGLHELATRDGTGRLQNFLNKHWVNAHPRTRDQRVSATKNLFTWAVKQGLIGRDDNPAADLERTRAGKQTSPRRAHPPAVLLQLLYNQTGDHAIRDKVCLALMGRLGLRKNAVRLMQARDVDRINGVVGFRLKGGGWAELPYGVFKTLADDVDFLFQVEAYQPRDYLLYPKADRDRPMEQSSMHRWFKRCLDNAGLPDFPMHELRHSAAQFTKNATNSDVAKDLLKHASVQTTELYLHPDDEKFRSDLALVEEAWQEGLVAAGLRSAEGWVT